MIKSEIVSELIREFGLEDCKEFVIYVRKMIKIVIVRVEQGRMGDAVQIPKIATLITPLLDTFFKNCGRGVGGSVVDTRVF